MTDDFGRLFAALAIKRGLVSPQQIASLLKRADQSQPLDAQMVRAGWVSASDRLELLSEMDSEVLAAAGDVESAVRSARKESSEVDEFISLYDSSIRTVKTDSSAGSDDDAGFEETMVRPETHASHDHAGDLPAGEGRSADSDDNPIAPVRGGFSKTDTSRASNVSDNRTNGDSSKPFDGTLIYQADSQPGKEKSPKKDDGNSDSDSRATVDYKPEYHSRYTLTQVYGEGGLGQVWLATDPALKREIALKRIRPGKDGSRVLRCG
jgi:hypothetical protein